jgi:endonuclease/exonuclease/phosphatase (EEP) superfamily protein YafD
MAGRPGSGRDRDQVEILFSSPGHKTRSQIRAEERAAQRAETRSGRRADEPARPVPSLTRAADAAANGRHRSRRLTVVLMLAALAVAGWAGTCFVDTGEPFLVALTTLAPVLSVLALPVLAIAVARRQAIPAGTAIAAAIVPWVLVAGSAVAGPGPTSEGNQPALRVMTVDGATGKASAPTIVRAIRSFGVDALVVTGMSSGLAHDLTVAGLNSLVTPRWVSIPAGKSAGAGLWTLPAIGATSPIPGFSQPATITQLTIGAGTVSLVVAHTGGSTVVPDRHWRADLRALGAATPSGPRILAGALGGTPWHPAFRKLRSHGWYEAADVLGRGLRPTWPAWGPVPFSPLDQVMVGGGVGVSRADTITIPGTSHRALLVTVVLPGSENGPSADAGD